ncbi:hypothetical protein A3D42_00760 [Candidatus Nomurabacteria bacterium RIFCSPHIGHO2_02_FULL_41_18]|uniref:Recombination protein RecR n=1 Tax=Candidatus Nomurabacteria bacterium RIFCSPHIGHO2_02_FULL_41_18 TaxID=1801754 RepID=A0A1F6W526_9BACT|nr:MAG: hypothetical protein A2737_01175 [Candidatus Nomurabacteria bacterium RIFCSPHIGHO2_01_FULL_41_71]OGI77037.1 MAG: hypothetical protein A3D42_00760 [Candidatus Nomurabacteria bacterium RIFCSPHIGHO2_02_FULL_41_18]OGI90158.1 MAG: hypothetical protein A3B01_02565 [Candidatus Nomurabacteria bacterium RIFCSPLOWO2_01_FULL_41_52b]OGJ00524.1 MAG: hypothetical protein A3I90_00310 [Candidatus Nomurabacteria bacterium RIFCSPLOWO2_02_FULL_41_9]
MNTIEKLTEIFKEFPGIGERQARRFVYFLMFKNSAYAENLSKLIVELKKESSQCGECFRFFLTAKTKSNLCDICSNSGDNSLLMVVEKDSDLESVQKSGIYNGKYFILGGLVPIVEKNTKNRVRIEELKNGLGANDAIKEIILAFSLNPQGDYTDQYVREELTEIVKKKNIKISSLGRGLSTGTELEYSDNDTLKNALKNRQ